MDHFLLDHEAVITSLATGAIQASVEELRSHDRLTIALREALRSGVDINDLSDMSGLTTAEIRRRVDGNLAVLDDFALLAG